MITDYQNIIFDCDSTLTTIEGIDWLAKRKGKEAEVQVLTAQAMDGRIEFEQVFAKRLALIRPERKDLNWFRRRHTAPNCPARS
jgi:phosphoserine phosphatase